MLNSLDKKTRRYAQDDSPSRSSKSLKVSKDLRSSGSKDNPQAPNCWVGGRTAGDERMMTMTVGDFLLHLALGLVELSQSVLSSSLNQGMVHTSWLQKEVLTNACWLGGPSMGCFWFPQTLSSVGMYHQGWIILTPKQPESGAPLARSWPTASQPVAAGSRKYGIHSEATWIEARAAERAQ